MISVKLTSYLYGRTELSGDYAIPSNTTIVDFAHSFEIAWDQEALIVVNDQIVERDYVLREGDHIFFLSPLVGG